MLRLPHRPRRRPGVGTLLVPYAAALLVLATPGVFGGGRRQQEEAAALGRARAARDAAADAFVELDRLQRLTEARVTGFAGLDGGPQGRSLHAAYAALEARAEQATHDYIRSLDEHPVEDGLPAPALHQAAAALGEVGSRLHASRAEIEQFAATNESLFHRLEDALASVAPRVNEARAQLAAARAAVAAAEADGMHSPAATEQLRHAEEQGSRLDAGAHTLGLAETLRAADLLLAAATSARLVAAELPAQRDKARRDISSLRTREQVVTGRLANVAPALSTLRRRFAERCFADVADCERQAVAALEQGRQELERAATALAAGELDVATRAAATAREALRRAEAQAGAAPARLALLDQAAADPTKVAAGAWFAVKDAQRLVVALGERRDPTWVALLDGAVLELERAQEQLSEGVHPDYWRFLQAVDRATAMARRVVDEVRSRPR